MVHQPLFDFDKLSPTAAAAVYFAYGSNHSTKLSVSYNNTVGPNEALCNTQHRDSVRVVDFSSPWPFVTMNDRSSAEQDDRQQAQERQQQQSPDTDDTDTRSHLSLALMSTSDDVSSLGETHTHYSSHRPRQVGRRKRKDDCDGSRCTVASDESARSRNRRRILLGDSGLRWQMGNNRTASSENAAPIQPQRRSDDDNKFQAEEADAPLSKATAETQPPPSDPMLTEEATMTRPKCDSAVAKGSGRPRSDSSPPMMAARDGVNRATTTASSSRLQPMPADTREVARTKSMTAPPVCPTRTIDDSNSNLTINSSSTDDDDDEEDEDETDKNEIDPDLFARLLEGHQEGEGKTPPVATFEQATHNQHSAGHIAPPQIPRRRSDADAFLYKYQPRQLKVPRVLSHQPGRCRRDTLLELQDGDRPQRCRSGRDDCVKPTSPRPPSMPSRTVDCPNCANKGTAPRNISDDAGNGELGQHASRENDSPLPKASVHRVSEPSAYTESVERPESESGEGEAVMTDLFRNLRKEMSSSQMDTEQQGESAAEETDDDIVEEDLTEFSASVKEYDPELFERLLHGDDTAAAQSDPPPPPLARVSSSQTKNSCPAYDRFDNSINCTLPEHIEGAVKSSHPPMRPRRSFDEGMIVCGDKCAVALAAAAAAARMADSAAAGVEIQLAPRQICSVGTKRRYSRRQSRRSTMPLATEQVTGPGQGDKTPGERAYDPTHEAELVALQLEEKFSTKGTPENDERDEYYQTVFGQESCNLGGQADLSYQRILPIQRHRRLVRRFTMPSKWRAPSPVMKKPRVHRSLSCRSSDESINSPAA